MDVTSLLDALFTLLAAASLAFLFYGACLCAAERTTAQDDAQRSAAPAGGDGSAIQV